MNPNDVASVATLLTPVLGARAAGVASLVALAVAVISVALPWVPVATASSSAAYRALYGILARIASNYRNAAPMPPLGEQPAGGLVPTPPSIKGT